MTYFKQADVGGDEYWYDEPCRACASDNHGIAEPYEGGWRCMCCRIPLTVMLTDAPVAYDYTPCDTDLGDVEVTYVPTTWFKGKVRSVAVPSGTAARYQFDRYLSGSYTVVTVWPVNV